MCSRRPRSEVHCGAVWGCRFLGGAPIAPLISPLSVNDGNLNKVHNDVLFLGTVTPTAIEYDAL
jgi:hypothetical protein